MRKLQAEDELRIGRAIRRLEGEIEGILRRIPQAAAVLSRRTRRVETTASGHVDRLGEAVEVVNKIRPRPISYTELRQKWAEADELRWKLAMSGYRIAAGEARKLGGRGIQVEDLVSEGIVGLLDAARRFDPERKLRFSTYARWWVRARMLRTIDTTSSAIRLPGGLLEKHRRSEKMRGQLGTGGKNVDEADLASAVGMSVQEIRMLEQAYSSVQTISLSLPSEGDGRDQRARTLEDTISDPSSPDPEDCAVYEQLKAKIQSAVSRLPPRQAEVIQAYLGIDGTMQDAASSVGLSRERVRQILMNLAAVLQEEDPDAFGEDLCSPDEPQPKPEPPPDRGRARRKKKPADEEVVE